MECVSMEDFRAALGGYLNRAHLSRESIIITRNGSPFVILRPVALNDIPDGEINAKDIRLYASRLLGQVHFQDSAMLIRRRGKPMAVLTKAKVRARRTR